MTSTAFTPIVLAVAVVVLQLTLSRTTGSAAQWLTVAAVVAFVAASLSHAWLVRGWRVAVRLAVVAGGVGLLAEVVGVRTGVPFGSYEYAGTLGPQVASVPIVIPMAWTMMAYPAAVVGRHIGVSTTAAILVATVALAAWDLFLDPQMVAEGHWTWSQPGPSLAGIPLVNHLGWLVVSGLMMSLVVPAVRTGVDDRVPIALYVWTWLGSVVAHAVLLDLPTSAVTGGLGMGAVVAALAVRRLVRRPTR